MHLISVVRVIAFFLTHTFTTAADGCLRYHDVASRTVIADIIFQGRLTSLPEHINQSESNDSYVSEVENNNNAIFQANFSVERVLKGELSAGYISVLYRPNFAHRLCRQLNVSREVIEETVDNDDFDEPSVDGENTVLGMRYIVFLNTSRLTSHTTENRSALTSSVKAIHWALGSPELRTSKALRTVLALACQHCGMSSCSIA
jgi:hypothetical protein